MGNHVIIVILKSKLFIWPNEDLTITLFLKNDCIFFALAGDSTIINIITTLL